MSLRSWIVVADRRTARFFFHGAPGEALEQVGPVSMDFEPVNEPADRPGRVHERSGQGRHGMQMQTPPDKAELVVAGKAIASALGAAANSGAFDRVVIAATHELIGAIRPHLSTTVSGHPMIEIHHRLIQLSDKELAQRLTQEDVIGVVRYLGDG